MTNRTPLTAAPKPVLSIAKEATVLDAVRAMVSARVGATVVLDTGRLAGVFTERDVVTRVVFKGLDPAKTGVAEVMTKSVVTVREDADRSSALKLMTEHHIRHLPVLDAEGRVITMLSMRHLLRAEVQDLRQTVWELVAENTIDAPGG
jgi:CBS domain-containing protein